MRPIIYTTNTLECFNRQLRKVTKVRTSFPTDDAIRKALYLATEQIMSKVNFSKPKYKNHHRNFYPMVISK
ncbi:transposase [Clostridium sp. YIM B02505]|uniref:Transposase n=1 Tax=Clostridium yunnanense TaxID=2800325 RepID=A0ABS1EPP5_9CLOT|nr:transposase [Clostridium yunnanense]